MFNDVNIPHPVLDDNDLAQDILDWGRSRVIEAAFELYDSPYSVNHKEFTVLRDNLIVANNDYNQLIKNL